jgi:hypothetical protein
MTTIAETATITITPATQKRWTSMVDTLRQVFEAFAEAVSAAARAIAEAFSAVTDFFADLDRKAAGRPRWMVFQDEKFARRGALSTRPLGRAVSPR